MRLVARIVGHHSEPRVKHYEGLPPDLNKGEDERRLLAHAAVLLIETNPSGIFLVRLTAEGEQVGDTWHETIEFAKEQADYEFAKLSPWTSVPAEVEDVVAFGLRRS